jgi:hypothetical protein
MLKIGAVVVSGFFLVSVLPTSAEDWIASRLQGNVELFVGGQWKPLMRGDTVFDTSKIRTESSGRVELSRGEEIISLGGNTEIVINQADAQRMTRIVQVWGTVSVEAEKRNVQHFSVQTPVLAALVKGTQFTVTYRNGVTRVAVDEGVVEVLDLATNSSVDLRPGQSAAASQMRPVKVSGPGSENVVYVIDGKVVAATAREAALERLSQKMVPENAHENSVNKRAGGNANEPGQGMDGSAAAANNKSEAAAGAGGGNGDGGGQSSAPSNPAGGSQSGNGADRP